MKPTIFYFLRNLVAPFEDVLIKLPHEGTILDVGCGHGLLAQLIVKRYPKTKVVGVDIDPNRIKLAQNDTKNDPRFTFAVCDLTRDDLPHKQFDAIVCFDILHHVPPHTQEEIIKKVPKLLKKEGHFLLKEIDRSPGWKYLWNLTHDTITTREKIYCRHGKDWAALMNSSGLSVKEITYPKKGLFYPHVFITARKKS